MTFQANLRIKGRVQGVFFRDWAQIEAVKRKLTGWIRNEDDYDLISACVQGEKEQIEQFIALCRKGPANSKVESVETQWDKDIGETFSAFEIRY